MKAYNLARVDNQYDMHMKAWLNQQVQATKENGKPVYNKFKDFFDYEKHINEIDRPKSKLTPNMRRLARIAARVNEGR